MLATALLAALCVQLTTARHTHQEYFFSRPTQGHEGQCYDMKVNVYAKQGETWTTTGCKLATCVMKENYNGEEELAISEDGCEVIRRKPGCRQTAADRTAKYPDCCPKLQCRKTTFGKVVTIPGVRRYSG